VEIAHHGNAPDDPLAGELQDEAEHSVGRGMLRAHVEDEFLNLALFDLDRRERVIGRVFDSLSLEIGGGYLSATLHDLLA
jgi:hypothetical protein